MFEIVASVLLTAIVASAAWLATHFLANPILKFYRLREDAHVTLFYTANVAGNQADADQYNVAAAELRRLAARLDALGVTAKLAGMWFTHRGYKLHKAAESLTGLANSLDNTNSRPEVYRTEIEKALKLPQRYSDQTIELIKSKTP